MRKDLISFCISNWIRLLWTSIPGHWRNCSANFPTAYV